MERKNKSDLINTVAEKTGINKANVMLVVDETLDAIKDSLKNGDTLSIAGFGIFSVTDRAARTARNPRTGETIEVAASRAPKLKPGKALKDAVN